MQRCQVMVLRWLRSAPPAVFVSVGAAAGDGRRRVVVFRGEAVERGAGERGGDDADGGGGDERARHGASYDLAVWARERYGEARGGDRGLGRHGGHGRRQERGRQGEDLVPAVEHDRRRS
jgi:hypothetical protein